ncbi:MAG: hypothetical protein AAFW46_15895 [Pseudomonadota bacterium]
MRASELSDRSPAHLQTVGPVTALFLVAAAMAAIAGFAGNPPAGLAPTDAMVATADPEIAAERPASDPTWMRRSQTRILCLGCAGTTRENRI